MVCKPEGVHDIGSIPVFGSSLTVLSSSVSPFGLRRVGRWVFG